MLRVCLLATLAFTSFSGVHGLVNPDDPCNPADLLAFRIFYSSNCIPTIDPALASQCNELTQFVLAPQGSCGILGELCVQLVYI